MRIGQASDTALLVLSLESWGSWRAATEVSRLWAHCLCVCSDGVGSVFSRFARGGPRT